MSTISSGSSGLTWTSDNSSNLAITLTSIVDNTGNTVTGSTVVKGSAKAWGSYAFVGAGSTPTLRSTFNISSITRNSTGNYTFAFTTAMPNVNYSYCCVATHTSGAYSNAAALTKTTSNVIVQCGYYNAGFTPYDYGLDFTVFD
jgi:hypothetical protein